MFGNTVIKDCCQVSLDASAIQEIAMGSQDYEPIIISAHRLHFAEYHGSGGVYSKRYGIHEVMLQQQDDVYLVRITDMIARATISVRTVVYWHELQNIINVLFDSEV